MMQKGDPMTEQKAKELAVQWTVIIGQLVLAVQGKDGWELKIAKVSQ